MRAGVLPLVAALALVAGAARADDHLVLELGGTTLETRHVAHGTFVQGTAPGEPGHDRDEEPAHQVTITHDFWIGKYPVTRGQFAKFVADTRYVTDAEKGGSGGAGWDGRALVQKKGFTWKSPGFTQTDEHPVVLVTFGDANAFSGWASRKTGKRVRLPTEAEWELAARGGTATPWYGGTTELENMSIGWFKGNAGNGTRPVGQKKANPLGIFDMSGNVYEWCRDVYAPYRDAAAIDPEQTSGTSAEPERRVLRGGSWLRDIKKSRSGARYRNAPGSRNADNGFRVVVTTEETVGPNMGGAGPDFAPVSPLGASPSPTSGEPSVGSGVFLGPLADGEPVRLEPIAHTTDTFSWGLLLVSPLAAASAAVAWMLLRRKRGGARVSAHEHAVSAAPRSSLPAPPRAPSLRSSVSPSARPSAPPLPAARPSAPPLPVARPSAPPLPVRPGVPPAPNTAPSLARLAAAGLAAASLRVEEDGFFAIVPEAPPGSRLRYECMVNGVAVADIVPLAGLETFVYTGAPPSSVRLIEIVGGPSSGGYRVVDPQRAEVDPELVPPSSRPRPAPFPTPRGIAPPLPARASSSMRVVAVGVVAEEPSVIVIPSINVGAPVGDTSSWSQDAPPVPASDSSSIPVSDSSSPILTGDATTDVSMTEVATDVSGTDVAPRSALAALAPAPETGTTTEAFLGNPRAY